MRSDRRPATRDTRAFRKTARRCLLKYLLRNIRSNRAFRQAVLRSPQAPDRFPGLRRICQQVAHRSNSPGMLAVCWCVSSLSISAEDDSRHSCRKGQPWSSGIGVGIGCLLSRFLNACRCAGNQRPQVVYVFETCGEAAEFGYEPPGIETFAQHGVVYVVSNDELRVPGR